MTPNLIRSLVFTKLPDEAFQGLFKAFFTFAIPTLLVLNVPTRVLADKLEYAGSILLLVAMSLACFAVSDLAGGLRCGGIRVRVRDGERLNGRLMSD